MSSASAELKKKQHQEAEARLIPSSFPLFWNENLKCVQAVDGSYCEKDKTSGYDFEGPLRFDHQVVAASYSVRRNTMNEADQKQCWKRRSRKSVMKSLHVHVCQSEHDWKGNWDFSFTKQIQRLQLLGYTELPKGRTGIHQIILGPQKPDPAKGVRKTLTMFLRPWPTQIWTAKDIGYVEIEEDEDEKKNETDQEDEDEEEEEEEEQVEEDEVEKLVGEEEKEKKREEKQQQRKEERNKKKKEMEDAKKQKKKEKGEEEEEESEEAKEIKKRKRNEEREQARVRLGVETRSFNISGLVIAASFGTRSLWNDKCLYLQRLQYDAAAAAASNRNSSTSAAGAITLTRKEHLDELLEGLEDPSEIGPRAELHVWTVPFDSFDAPSQAECDELFDDH